MTIVHTYDHVSYTDVMVMIGLYGPPLKHDPYESA